MKIVITECLNTGEDAPPSSLIFNNKRWIIIVFVVWFNGTSFVSSEERNDGAAGDTDAVSMDSVDKSRIFFQLPQSFDMQVFPLTGATPSLVLSFVKLMFDHFQDGLL